MGATTKSSVATPAAGASGGTAADAGHLRRLRAMLGCIDDALAEHERAARAGPGFQHPAPPGDLPAAEESAKRLLVYLTGMDGRVLDQALGEMRD